LSVTQFIPADQRQTRHQYLLPVIILSVAFYSNFMGKANACSTWSGQTGVASYYGPGFQGHRTANGETFDQQGLTAAHSCLPLGTKILVTVPDTGRALVVTVNDRMPRQRRILDLSLGAARALGIVSRGVALVQLSPTHVSAIAAR
jgi:rare lipoprotein A (peptidoglycan hydrolase)